MKLLEQRKTTLRAREIPYGACQPHKGNETPTGSNGQKAEGGKPKKGGNKRPIGRLIRARALAPIPAGGPQCTLADSDAKILGHWGSSRRVRCGGVRAVQTESGSPFPAHTYRHTHTHVQFSVWQDRRSGWRNKTDRKHETCSGQPSPRRRVQ